MKIRQTTPREVILDLRAAHKQLDGVHPRVFISTAQLAIEQAIDCIERMQEVIQEMVGIDEAMAGLRLMKKVPRVPGEGFPV